MNAQAYIQKVRAAGFTLAIEGDRLLVSPIENLTAGQRQSLSDHKPEIIAALRSSDTLLDSEGGNDLAPANDLALIHVPEYETASGSRYAFDMTVPKVNLPALKRTSLKFKLIDDQGGGYLLGSPGKTEEELRDVLGRKYGDRLESINGETL